MPANEKRNPEGELRWPDFKRRVEMRQVGIQRNGQEQVEALVRLLLEPVGRRQRKKLVGLIDSQATRPVSSIR